ncbi:hypothetical protein H4R33_007207, partial [Dimargaris cristalligena]
MEQIQQLQAQQAQTAEQTTRAFDKFGEQMATVQGVVTEVKDVAAEAQGAASKAQETAAGAQATAQHAQRTARDSQKATTNTQAALGGVQQAIASEGQARSTLERTLANEQAIIAQLQQAPVANRSSSSVRIKDLPEFSGNQDEDISQWLRMGRLMTEGRMASESDRVRH